MRDLATATLAITALTLVVAMTLSSALSGWLELISHPQLMIAFGLALFGLGAALKRSASRTVSPAPGSDWPTESSQSARAA